MHMAYAAVRTCLVVARAAAGSALKELSGRLCLPLRATAPRHAYMPTNAPAVSVAEHVQRASAQ
jgi:hypothetical protein